MTLAVQSEDKVCPNDQIILTCVVRGSYPILSWTSDHHITSNQPIEFSPSSMVGIPKSDHNNPDTTATLTSKRSDGGIQILTSELTIMVSSGHRTFSVTCRDSTDDTSRTVTMNLSCKLIPTFEAIVTLLHVIHVQLTFNVK